MAYSQSQLDEYCIRIGYNRSRHPAGQSLRFLTELQAHHLFSVPFESVSLHYSKHRMLSLDPQDLFAKVVGRSMGGYCMELNTAFGEVLKGLGFKVMATGARVMGGEGRYTGWNHMVNLVTIDGQCYLVDVGFGKGGPMVPVPLLRDARDGGSAPTNVFVSVQPALGKLEYRALPQHSDPDQRVWVYSSNDGQGGGWSERYCFAEVEFFPEDFEVMNLHTSTSPRSYFVKTVLAVKVLLGHGGSWPGRLDEPPKAKGVIVLHKDELKRTFEGKTEVLEVLGSEAARRAALQRFGIVLTDEEANAIKGLATELTGS